MNAVLEVRDLAKAFGGIRAVNGVSFEVREGEILGLIGPNGSGKSTLFNCILGQLAPSAGEVRIDGRGITGMRPLTYRTVGWEASRASPGVSCRRRAQGLADAVTVELPVPQTGKSGEMRTTGAWPFALWRITNRSSRSSVAGRS